MVLPMNGGYKALDRGSGVEKIRVAEKRVAPCLGCCYCAQNGDRKDGKRVFLLRVRQ